MTLLQALSRNIPVIIMSGGLGKRLRPITKIIPKPISPYGASKLAGEGYCSAYFHSFGLNTVALRFGNVYGPGSMHKGSVVSQFIKSALNKEEIQRKWRPCQLI